MNGFRPLFCCCHEYRKKSHTIFYKTRNRPIIKQQQRPIDDSVRLIYTPQKRECLLLLYGCYVRLSHTYDLVFILYAHVCVCAGRARTDLYCGSSRG